MDALYPTKTRLALLADIQAGKVSEDWYDDTPGAGPGDAWLGRWPQRTKVTAKVAEMKQAGWCETNPADANLHTRSIALTPAGEAVLSEHTQETTR